MALNSTEGFRPTLVDSPLQIQKTATVEAYAPKTTFQEDVEWGQRLVKPVVDKTIYHAVRFQRAVAWTQYKLDLFGMEIERKLSSLSNMVGYDKLNKALNKEFKGDWKLQLAHALWQVPGKSVTKILNQLYNLIRAILVAIVHPVDSTKKLLQMLKQIIASLSKPETWSGMGSGMIGANLGSAAVGNPLSFLGMLIGSIALFGGLSAGAIRDATKAYKKM